jgi:hypothetical protein
MKAKTRIAAITLAVLIGTAILFKVPGLGGFILGTAFATAVAAGAVDRRTEQLRASTRELDETREQYNAAHGTLVSQRRRMVVEMEGRIAEHTARLNAAHNAELFRAQLACYEQGAIDALTGRLDDREEPGGAAVIPIAHRRQRPRTDRPTY